jgi:hypothetical protein
MFFIGDEIDYQSYQEKCNQGKTDVSDLPVRNLPMSYFPFFYNNSESSIDKMQRLFPLFENYTKSVAKMQGSSGSEGATCSVDGGTAASNNIDTDKLFGLLSQLEEPYQPYNNNNAKHITYVVFIIWGLLFFYFMKIVHTYLKSHYLKIIIASVFLLLLFGVLWTLFVTNTVL